MDICKNELTSPFKIPLKDKEKSKGSPAVATRSPLADPHDTRERDVQNLKARQKKRIAEQAQARDAKKARKAVENSITQDPLAVVDRICGEMAAASRVKREQRRESEERPPRHVDTEYALSREALERHAQDDTMAREFIRRDSLMERLLGHKMLYGRLESYTSMGYMKSDSPPDASSMRVEPGSDFAGGSSKPRRGPRTPPPPPESSLQAPPLETTPQRPRPRGPKTPPGSPGPRTPPPQQLQASSSSVAPAMQTLLANIAAMAGTSGSQLASSLGDDLNRIVGNVNTGVFLESFVTALRSATAQNAVSAVPPTAPPLASQEKLAQPGTPVRDVSSRSLSRREMDTDSVKMELVSDCSLSPLQDSQSQSQSPLKAPPPPPVIAPPPPPPVLPTPPVQATGVQPPPPPAPALVPFMPIGPPSIPVQAMQGQPSLAPPPFPVPPNFVAMPPPMPPYQNQGTSLPPQPMPTPAVNIRSQTVHIPTMIPASNPNAMSNMPNLTMPPPAMPNQTPTAQMAPHLSLTPSRAFDISAMNTTPFSSTPQKSTSDISMQNSDQPIIRVTIEDTTVSRNQPPKTDSRPLESWLAKNCTSNTPLKAPFKPSESTPIKPTLGARFDSPMWQNDNQYNDSGPHLQMNDRVTGQCLEPRPPNFNINRDVSHDGCDQHMNQKPPPPPSQGSLAPLPSQMSKPPPKSDPAALNQNVPTSQSVTNTLLSALGIGSSLSGAPKSQGQLSSGKGMQDRFGCSPFQPAPNRPGGAPGPILQSGSNSNGSYGLANSKSGPDFGGLGPNRMGFSGPPNPAGSSDISGRGPLAPPATGLAGPPGSAFTGPMGSFPRCPPRPSSPMGSRGPIPPPGPPHLMGAPGLGGSRPFRGPNTTRNNRQIRQHRGSAGRPYRPKE